MHGLYDGKFAIIKGDNHSTCTYLCMLLCLPRPMCSLKVRLEVVKL